MSYSKVTAALIPQHYRFGIFSYGNDTSLGSSVLAYLQSQSLVRNQTVVLVPSNPEQDKAAADYLNSNYPDMNGVTKLDNCAVRTNYAFIAAGFQSLQHPFPGGLTRNAASIPGAVVFFIPKGGSIPQELIDKLPLFEANSNDS